MSPVFLNIEAQQDLTESAFRPHSPWAGTLDSPNYPDSGGGGGRVHVFVS